MTMAYGSCRRTCGTTILRLREIQRVLDVKGGSAECIVITYHSENDDPRAWTQFRKTRNLDRPNWHFLSGSKWNVSRVSWLLGLDFGTMDSHVIHDFKIVVLDSDGALNQQISMAPVDFERLF